MNPIPYIYITIIITTEAATGTKVWKKATSVVSLFTNIIYTEDLGDTSCSSNNEDKSCVDPEGSIDIRVLLNKFMEFIVKRYYCM